MTGQTTRVEVRVEREGRLWVLRISGVGVTQARHLREVERMVADYVAIMRGVDPAAVDVTVKGINPGAALAADIAAARQAYADAAAAQAAAATQWREVAAALRGQGLTVAEIATVLEVSPQRVSQLVPARRSVSRARGGRGRADHTVPAVN
jgi:thioesterase domain-containing protein